MRGEGLRGKGVFASGRVRAGCDQSGTRIQVQEPPRTCRLLGLSWEPAPGQTEARGPRAARGALDSGPRAEGERERERGGVTAGDV